MMEEIPVGLDRNLFFLPSGRVNAETIMTLDDSVSHPNPLPLVLADRFLGCLLSNPHVK